jgi:hypothetical protein
MSIALVTVNTPAGLVGISEGGASGAAGWPPHAASEAIENTSSRGERTRCDDDMTFSGKRCGRVRLQRPCRALAPLRDPLVPRGSSSRTAGSGAAAAVVAVSGFWPDLGQGVRPPDISDKRAAAGQ